MAILSNNIENEHCSKNNVLRKDAQHVITMILGICLRCLKNLVQNNLF